MLRAVSHPYIEANTKESAQLEINVSSKRPEQKACESASHPSTERVKKEFKPPLFKRQSTTIKITGQLLSHSSI